MARSWLRRMPQNKARPVSRAGQRPSRRPSSVRPRIEALEDRQVPTVSFFGGNLLPQVQAQALYLGNEFLSAPANTEPAALDGFLKDITGGPYLQALARAGYNVGPGSAVAGAIDPTAPTVGSTISAAFIRARLQADVNSGLLRSPNANTLYVVYVEPDVAVNLGSGRARRSRASSAITPPSSAPTGRRSATPSSSPPAAP